MGLGVPAGPAPACRHRMVIGVALDSVRDVPHGARRASHRTGLTGRLCCAGLSDPRRLRSGFGLRDTLLTRVGRPRRDAITVDLARSGADLDLRPDRADGAIW